MSDDSPIKFSNVTFPTLILLYISEPPLVVPTVNRYEVAPATAFQFAVNPVDIILVAAVAVGAAGGVISSATPLQSLSRPSITSAAPG